VIRATPAGRRLLASAGVGFAASRPWLIGAWMLVGAGLSALGRRRRFGLWVLAVGWLAHAARLAVIRASSPCSRASAGNRATETVGDEPGVTLRLVTANLWNGSDDVTELAAELERTGADIVVLQEVTPWHLRQFEEAGTLRSLPFEAVNAYRGHAGLGVWSRFSLSGVDWFTVSGEPQCRAWARLPGGRRLRIYALHAPAPMPGKVGRWREWFTAMAGEAAREVAEHKHPVVMAGDFNATVDHRAFRALLKAGFCDSALVTRNGWRMTWPADRRALPGLFRIDHVLVRPGARVARYRVGRGSGSDHRPLIVDLVLTN
jgi:endonuclease/exonuclease/phosphatase (EEP) superfamily protein YafD